MIISESSDNKVILFNPESSKERSTIDKMPAFERYGLSFFCQNSPNLVINLIERIKRLGITNIRYTPLVREYLTNGLVLKEIPEDFEFITTPLPHQRIALRYAYTVGRFGLLLEPGLGKTKIILDFIKLMNLKKSVIVCPKALRFVWEDECALHRPDLSIYVVKSTNWEEELEGVTSSDIVVVNYNKAITLLEDLTKLKAEFLGIDEGLIKNPSTDRTKALTKLSRGIPYKSIMSGTLVNNSPLDVFSPIRFLEPSLVGTAFGKFKDEYSIASRHNKYIVVGYKHKEEVRSILESCSIVMTKKEWIKDLPEKEFIHIYAQLSDEQRRVYQDLAHNYIAYVGNGIEIEVDNPLTLLIKLNQISNGFLYYKDDQEITIEEVYGELGKSKKKIRDRREIFTFEQQPKIEKLLELIRSERFKSEGPENPSRRKTKEFYDRWISKFPFIWSSRRNSIRNKRIIREKGLSLNKRCNSSRLPYNYIKRKEYEKCFFSPRNYALSYRPVCENKHSLDRRLFSKYTYKPIRVTSSSDADESKQWNEALKLHNWRVDTKHEPLFSEPDKQDFGRRKRGCVSKVTWNRKPSWNSKRGIIWYNQHAEVQLIEKCLSENSISYLTISGGVANTGEIVRRFNRDNSIQFLLCQALTINYGVTIMGSTESADDGEDVIPYFDPIVSDEIFYSVNFSLEVFLQQQDRIHRIGQKRKCRYWMILSNCPIERNIADRLEEKLLCNKEILVDIVNSIGNNVKLC